MCVLCYPGSPHPDGQALGESLNTNGSLRVLKLTSNNIGDRGVQVPVLECLPAGVRGCGDALGSFWTSSLFLSTALSNE